MIYLKYFIIVIDILLLIVNISFLARSTDSDLNKGIVLIGTVVALNLGIIIRGV